MNITLYGFHICPFVERIRILLHEKKIPCEQVHVDIRKKPDWFLKLSPLGKVPILKVDETILFESTVISELLNDLSSPPSLHPENLVKKSHNKAWVEWGCSLVFDAYYMTLAADKTEFAVKREIVEKKLTSLETQLKGKPFFNGTQFSMIDIAYAPLFKRFDCLSRMYDIDILSKFPLIQAWSNNTLNRSSVIAGFVENFDEELEILLKLKKNFLVVADRQR